MYTSNFAVKSMDKDETTTRSSHGTSRLRIGMGTTIAIHAEAYSVHDSLAGIEAAFAAIAQVEKLMHPSRTGGDLLAIHQGKLGLPVDRALMALRACRCHSGLVNAGGGLAVFGDRSQPVVIRSEGSGDSVVELQNAALATSDVCSAAKPTEHRGYHHGDTGAVLLETFDARVVACDFRP
jgi:thiamine biosynthesis lipoprotein ApbE